MANPPQPQPKQDNPVTIVGKLSDNAWQKIADTANKAQGNDKR